MTEGFSKLSQEAIKALEERYGSFDSSVSTIKNMILDDNVLESFIELCHGDYVWIINNQVYRYYIAPKGNGSFSVKRETEGDGDTIGVYETLQAAEEVKNEYDKVLGARALLSGGYDSEYLGFEIKIKKRRKNDDNSE